MRGRSMRRMPRSATNGTDEDTLTAPVMRTSVAIPSGRTNREHARRLVRTARWIIIAAIVPIGLWVSYAPLSMAVVAPALVKVELNRRPVQHLEGGIVRQVLVRDGQRVKAGDPVLILGDVGVDADRNRITYRVNVERAALARLEAEQALSPTLVFPAELHT